MGSPIKGAMQRVLERKDDGGTPPGAGTQNQSTGIILPPTNINPSDYVRIPNTNILIVKFEPDEFKGFNYESTHVELAKKSLFMPTARIFMPYFLNVIEACKGNIELFDGNGNKLSSPEIEDIYKHLTTAHINGGAWTWLNGKAVKGSGFKKLDLETITKVDLSSGTPKFVTNTEPLEACLWNDCYASLDFNSQGLVKAKAANQAYEQGSNIYFYYPRKDYVAWFWAYSDRADFNCFGDPAVTSASLGVFSCAVGAAQKNS